MATPSRPSSSMSSATPTRLHSTQGSTSVQVALRIRPPSTEDDPNVPIRFQKVVVQPVHASSTALVVDSSTATSTPRPNQKQTFTFDRVFGPATDQASIYDSVVHDLVSKFVEGYNVTCLAYGQTSAGKSYTMGTDYLAGMSLNPEANKSIGIIPRAISAIFDQLALLQQQGSTFEIRNSYIELYNEDLIDLLATNTGEKPQVTIRESKDGQIMWSGLREVKVNSVEDVMQNLSTGSAVRQTSATEMNAQSSRSHAIFSLTLTRTKLSGAPSPLSPSKNRFSALPRPSSPMADSKAKFALRPASSMSMYSAATGRDTPTADRPRESMAGATHTTVISKLHFVDLAGSERLKRTSAVGDRVKEGISINSGLHALGNVISALGDPVRARSATHIPYRDSKLTRLLQDSLGGNAATLMIACVDAREYNLNETINTLKYANRARNIKNTATINELEVGWDDVEHLQQMVLKLRSDLVLYQSGDHSDSGGQDRGAMLALQSSYSDLSQRHAKLTADLAKSGQLTVQQERTGRASLSPEDFAFAVAPVVEEYEKTLSALEGQLALTRVALQHTEDALREQEASYDQERTNSMAASEEILDLRGRLAKVGEREASTESYLRDLENRLKDHDTDQSTHQSMLTSLRTEITKQKEIDTNSEQYIKDLERRLAQSEESSVTLRKQIDAVEQHMRRQSIDDRALESYAAAAPSATPDLKALLTELDVKERRLQELDRELLGARLEQTKTKQLLDSLQAETDQNSTADDLRQRLAAVSLELEQKPTLVSEDSQSNIDAKYKDALRQIQDLSMQLGNAQVLLAQRQSPIQSLSTPPASPPRTVVKGDQDMEVLALPRSSSLSSTIPLSPSRTRRSIAGNPSANSAQGRIIASQSLSSLETGLRRSASLSQDWPSPRLSPTLTRTFSIARSVSPTPSRDSFLGLNDGERSNESYQKEVAQLQDVIVRREEEIRQLEEKLSAGRNIPQSNGIEDVNYQHRVADPVAKRHTNIIDRDQEMDDLLRSTAVKEAKHKEDVEQLTTNLATLQKEHDALQAVSRDQVSNMSIEIERLQVQLQTLGESNQIASERLQHFEEQFVMKNDEVEAAKLESAAELEQAQATLRDAHAQELEALVSDHARSTEALKSEHAGFLSQMVAQREQLFVSKTQDFDAAIEAQQAHLIGTVAKLEADFAQTSEQTQLLYAQQLDEHVKEKDALRLKLAEAVKSHEVASADAAQQLEAMRLRTEELHGALQLSKPKQQELAPKLPAAASRPESRLDIFVDASQDTPMPKSLDPLEQSLNASAPDVAGNLTPTEHSSQLHNLQIELDKSDAKRSEVEKALCQLQREHDDLKTAFPNANGNKISSQLETDLADMATLLDQLQRELEAATKERDVLADKQKQSELLLRELEFRMLGATRRGSAASLPAETPDLTRSASSASSNGASPALSLNRSTFGRLSTGPAGGKLPPKAPPPSSSLPPLPTALPQLPHIAESAKQSDSSTTDGSPTTASPNGVRSSIQSISTLDGLSLDPRVQKRLDEQDILLAKMAKQLLHAESDLKANIDLVNTLEGALNDTEKSLRKARMQTSDYARERDTQTKAKEQFRAQLAEATEEIQQLKERLSTTQQADTRATLERQQKDAARIQLEERLAELQNRKSKFACF